jgi:hypothetical protein
MLLTKPLCYYLNLSACLHAVLAHRSCEIFAELCSDIGSALLTGIRRPLLQAFVVCLQALVGLFTGICSLCTGISRPVYRGMCSLFTGISK